MSARQVFENATEQQFAPRINGALLDAAQRDDAESIRAILADPDEDVSNPGMTGQTPLHIAAANDSVNAIDALIELGANLDAQDVNRDTPLSVAASGQHSSAAMMLLANGANPHTHDHNGLSPLHRAVRRGDAEMVGILLDGGANPDHRNISTSGHENADEMAKRFGQEHIVSMLAEHRANKHANRIKSLHLHRARGARP